jgi:hypothetical protein
MASRTSNRIALAFLTAALLAGVLPLRAGEFMQGPKLFASAAGSTQQGGDVALDFDGNTAIVGDVLHDSTGGAWVFTRTAGMWVQQTVLSDPSAVGTLQGKSVAISAEGGTVAVGAYGDDSFKGAVRVYTRSGGSWTQQGAKLVGMGAVGSGRQGYSVALSSDGGTLLVGATEDDGGVGAAWVFTRTSGVWSQQGGKLVGTGATSPSMQGTGVALSGDGNTALISGPYDSSSAGAAWVFVRNNGVWTQQGGKLAGTGAVGAPFRHAVALSADGNTAALGGSGDDGGTGAVWIFNRSGTTWTQQGSKLVGTPGTDQGLSVALSLDGNTLLSGAPLDRGEAGAMWVFHRSGTVWTPESHKLWGSAVKGDAQLGWSAAISGDGRVAIAGGTGDDGALGASWLFYRICSKGDANGDEAVDVLDVFYLINFLFAGGAAPVCV